MNLKIYLFIIIALLAQTAINAQSYLKLTGSAIVSYDEKTVPAGKAWIVVDQRFKCSFDNGYLVTDKMTENQKAERRERCVNEYVNANVLLVYIDDTPYYSKKQNGLHKFMCFDESCDIDVVSDYFYQIGPGTKVHTNEKYWYIVVNEYDIVSYDKL